MEIGQIVDFCIEYNDQHGLTEEPSDKPKKKKANRRKATQADWDRFLG